MKKIVGFVILAAFLVGGFVAWNYYAQEQRHQREIALMRASIERLTMEERMAQVVVKERKVDADGQTWTTLEFLEWDRDGKPLAPLSCTVKGSEVYFDALIVKFQDQYVEAGESLRGKSLVLFRRIFGSSQTPESGIPVDSAAQDGVPAVYRVNPRASDFEKNLWKKFWEYADHPEASAKLGVRVMQVEAVANRLSTGAVYQLTLEADGGLNLMRVTANSK